MRESRLYGSEGGGAYTLPTPIIQLWLSCRGRDLLLVTGAWSSLANHPSRMYAHHPHDRQSVCSPRYSRFHEIIEVQWVFGVLTLHVYVHSP